MVIFPLLVLSLCLPIFAQADIIYLKSGDNFEGKILEKTDKYIKIDFQGVVLTYYLDEIERIEEKIAAGPASGFMKCQVDSGRCLKDILKASKNISSVKYEEIKNVYTSGNFTKSLKTNILEIWQKIPFAKMDIKVFHNGLETSKEEIVVRPEGIYVRSLTADKYKKFTEIVNWLNLDGIQKILMEIEDSRSLKLLGTETIDEKFATVVEYLSTSMGQSSMYKVWLWNEKGLPLKAEATIEVEGVNYLTKTEYKNFDFKDIPDSLFEVPKR